MAILGIELEFSQTIQLKVGNCTSKSFSGANPLVIQERGLVIRSSAKYSQELFLPGIKLEFCGTIRPGNSLTT
jgi:hypothetical protein